MSQQDLYQASHHELVASASVTKIGHEINSDFKIGRMVISMPIYPMTPHPNDVIASCELEKINYLFYDSHARGKNPNYIKRYFKEEGIEIKFAEGTKPY